MNIPVCLITVGQSQSLSKRHNFHLYKYISKRLWTLLLKLQNNGTTSSGMFLYYTIHLWSFDIEFILLNTLNTVPVIKQIIVTGDSEKDYFVLREENLASIIAKIPPDAKVSIVSVVGAFRTGKSFLLNFFLRYLRSAEHADESSSWMVSEGNTALFYIYSLSLYIVNIF